MTNPSLPWQRGPMLSRSNKRPRDLNQLAKLLTDIATGQPDPEKADQAKDPAAVARGRKGGLMGGKARAHKLDTERRSEIARHAASVRWKKSR